MSEQCVDGDDERCTDQNCGCDCHTGYTDSYRDWDVETYS